MQILNEKLKADPFFLDADKNIIREKVKASAINLDEHLIKLLLSDSDLKKIFFAEVNGVLVFDKVKFSWIISNSDFLPDSFTSYKNKSSYLHPRE